MFLDEAPSERAKQSIREKCVSYLDRAEKLKKHLADPSGKNKKKPVADGSKSSSGNDGYDWNILFTLCA